MVIVVGMCKVNRIENDKFYTSTEVAEFTGLSRTHVNRLANDGAFGALHRKSPVARSPRQFSGSSVVAFLEARKEAKTAVTC